MKKVIVQKFGGTSVGSGERLLGVAEIIVNSHKQHDLVVVVSAMSPSEKTKGTTSLLLQAADNAVHGKSFSKELEEIKKNHLTALLQCVKSEAIQTEVKQFIDDEIARVKSFLKALLIIRELTPRSRDNVIAAGEILSARLLTAVLMDKGENAQFINLANVLGDDFPELSTEFYEKAQEQFAEICRPSDGTISVVTGYFGSVKGGIIERIGRGYSDLTTALVSAGLGSDVVEEMQVWKEVDGICTSDPRRVPAARVLAEISASEASELTYFGSEVLHPFTMERVTSKSIPIRVKNTFNPAAVGTQIVASAKNATSPVTAITAKRGIKIVTVKSNRMYNAHGFLAKLFTVLQAHGVSVNLVSTSEVTVSFTIEDSSPIDAAIPELQEIGEISVATGRAILAVVGDRIKGTIGVAARMFSSLAAEKICIDMISQGASRVNVSCVILEEHIEQGMRAVHKAFLE